MDDGGRGGGRLAGSVWVVKAQIHAGGRGKAGGVKLARSEDEVAEHVSGARSAFARFARYQPRPDGAVGFTSGPKIAHFDRVEWLTLDTFSAMAALQKGEIDWWETPPRDLIEQIARDRDVTAVPQYATATGILRFNHLHPPSTIRQSGARCLVRSTRQRL